MIAALAGLSFAALSGIVYKLHHKSGPDNGDLPFESKQVPHHTHLLVRKLKLGDLSKGFFDLLSELTNATPVPEDVFRERYRQQRKSGQYCVLVIVDSESNCIVGTATLLVEKKFLRGCGAVGHIEDVVVSRAYRGRKLGQLLLRELAQVAFAAGCYKAILDCDADKAAFYQSCGFRIKGVQMAKYF